MTETVTGRPGARRHGSRVDPTTFEVIRHRLWAINDEQGRMAARLSGSFIVFDGYDFNASLVTADGQGLLCGIYILQHGATIDHFVRRVLDEWGPGNVREGDLFFTNDPWYGALHANDGILVAPVCVGRELVAWTGIVMHDNDVGSPIPGSFVPGATDRFGEAPLLPPVKIGEDFELRADIERIYLRNSRVPELNALNMRARVAAVRSTCDRLRELVDDYGVDTVLAVQAEILDYVDRVVRARLRTLPDGTWAAVGYHDHDGNNDEIYRISCAITKLDDRLIFDFAGTSPQAPGAINCALPALEGTVMGVVLTFLCHDLPWAIGGLHNIVEIRSEPGTVNNATSPAAISMGSVMGVLSTQDVVTHAFAKMMLCSEELALDAQASWSPGIADVLMVALRPEDEPSVGVVVDCFSGGGGARTFTDGVDSGGIFHSMASRCANVETVETRLPVLELWRRQLADAGGPGRFRGGVPVEFASLAHKLPIDPAIVTNLSSGVTIPAGRGLSGGLPGAPARIAVMRGSNVRAMLAGGHLPTSAEEISCAEVELPPAKSHFVTDPDDVVIGSPAGGGGFGDPLTRNVDRVAEDVRRRLVSAEQARSAYGVVFLDDAVDREATRVERERLRLDRRRASELDVPPARSGHVSVLHPVSDAIEAVEIDGIRELRCSSCHVPLSAYDGDPKRTAAIRDLPLTAIGSLNGACLETFVAREFSCPGCGRAFDVDVQYAVEAPPTDMRLGGAGLE